MTGHHIDSISGILERLTSTKFDDWINNYRLFREISGVEYLLSGDTEHFASIESYEELLEDMATLVAADLTMTNIGCKENDDDTWTFSFTLNGKAASCSIPAMYTDPVINEFINPVNEQLAPFTAKRFYHVFAGGEAFADQYFEIVYIEESTLKKLAAHPAVFAQLPSQE